MLDIDKAIAIIRNTEKDADVVPNLMNGFGINKSHGDITIRLRHINREYILKRLTETEALEKEKLLVWKACSRAMPKVRRVIIRELEAIIKKYPSPRRADILEADKIERFEQEDHIEDYPVHLFLSKEGYFKKITSQTSRLIRPKV